MADNMAKNENGSSKMIKVVGSILGIIISTGIIFGCLWTVFAKPQVSEQSRIEIKEWWDQSGSFKVIEIIDTRLEKKLEKFEKRQEMIYKMNLSRVSAHERRKYEIPDTTD
jgi:hypothetical protein